MASIYRAATVYSTVKRFTRFFACFAALAACDGQELRFDAASVKISDPKTGTVPQISGGPGSSDPGLLRAHANMSLLLQMAFGVHVDQIRGPAWLRDWFAMPFYDITATIPKNGRKKEDVEKMLQNLLIERFHLAYRRQTEQFPGYSLVVLKGSLKLKEVSEDSEPTAASSTAAGQGFGVDGFPIQTGPRTFGWSATAIHQRIKYQQRTMAEFSSHLAFLIGSVQGKTPTDGFFQPRVSDDTGLTGRYTFILQFECAACGTLVAQPRQDASATGTFPAKSNADASDFPDLFTAVQRQLGLKINKAEDVPTEVIEIGKLDKVPIAN